MITESTHAEESEDREALYIAQSIVMAAYSKFDSNIEAVRDLALHAKSHTKPLDDRRAHFLRLVRRWNAHESDESVLGLFDSIMARSRSALDSIKARLDRGEALEMPVKRALRLARTAVIDEHTHDATDRFRYRTDVGKVLDRRNRNLVLHSSLLVSAVASFEVLIGDIVRAYMTGFPAVMTSSEMNISTQFLIKFATLEEFWETYRAKRVEKLMRDDIEAWFEWIAKYLKIEAERLSPDHKQLIEVFLTRNLHIHNAGKVNEIYLTSAKQSGVTPRSTGMGLELPISPKYLLQSVELLQVTGQVATFGALRKLDSKLSEDDRYTDAWLHDAIYALLEDGLYTALLSLAALVRDITGERDEVTQVNVWVALKEISGIQAIEDDVNAWDTSDLDPRFQLVKSALLDDFPAAHEIADRIFGTKALSRADWNSWPVLRGLREWVSADPDRGRFLLRSTAESNKTPESD